MISSVLKIALISFASTVSSSSGATGNGAAAHGSISAHYRWNYDGLIFSFRVFSLEKVKLAQLSGRYSILTALEKFNLQLIVDAFYKSHSLS